MVEFTVRNFGLDYEQNFANEQAMLSAFGKWRPDPGLNILAFVATIPGTSGYMLAETDNPKSISNFASHFAFWLDTKVVPVVDIADAVADAHVALAWARGAVNP